MHLFLFNLLPSEYEEDLTGCPSDIEEYENESMSTIDPCKTQEHDVIHDDSAESINKIVLLTPKAQQNVYHIYPTIKFQSLNEYTLDSTKSMTNMNKRKSKVRSRLIDAFKELKFVVRFMMLYQFQFEYW